MLLDYTHIYHLGYGMDSASSIILCNLGQLDLASKLDVRLEEAYLNGFDLWANLITAQLA